MASQSFGARRSQLRLLHVFGISCLACVLGRCFRKKSSLFESNFSEGSSQRAGFNVKYEEFNIKFSLSNI